MIGYESCEDWLQYWKPHWKVIVLEFPRAVSCHIAALVIWFLFISAIVVCYIEKAYRADLDQPIWIFVILSHLVDFKLIRIFAWHSLRHSEWPYLTFNYHTAFVGAKIHLFWCAAVGCVSVCVHKREREKEIESVWLSSLSVWSCDVTASLIYCTGVFSRKQRIGGSPIKGNKAWQAIADSPLSAPLTTSQTYTFNIPLIDWFYGTWLTLSSILPSRPRHQLRRKKNSACHTKRAW